MADSFTNSSPSWWKVSQRTQTGHLLSNYDSLRNAHVCWCKQTLELRKLLEEYLASELALGEYSPLSGWSSPPTTRSRSVKPTVHSFVTQGCSEVAAKLAVIEDHLKPISVYQTTPSTPRQACSSHISTWLWLFLKSVMRIQIVGWWHCLSTPLLYESLSLWCSPSQSAPTAPLAAMSLTR